MRHGVPEIEIRNDLNFSAMAHSDKQISRQILFKCLGGNVINKTRIALYTWPSGVTEK